jgi:hypothetical protein
LAGSRNLIPHRHAAVFSLGNWLTGDKKAARGLLLPWPDGLLAITEAKDVGWTQP